MIAYRKKALMYLVALATLIASAFLMFGIVKDAAHSYASAASSSITDFSIPAGSDPWGTAFDSSGRVWVAIPGCDPSPTCSSGTPPGKLAVFDPTSSNWVRTYSLPSGYGQPLFLAFDKSGRVWFPMPMTNSIGMFNPSNNSFHQWAVPTASSGPWGVAIDSNGNVWFTEHYSNKIGRFNPNTHTFKEIATTASNSQPYGITVDKSNNVWFTENNSAVAMIGEYTAQGALKEYKIRNGSTTGLTPHLITVDPNGNIWWSEGWVSSIGELKVAAAQPGTNNGVSEYTYQLSCSNCGSHTSGISAASNGQIWFDDSLQSFFGSFPNTGSGSFSIYQTPTTNSHPHDGLNVDQQNRVWFDEEFANKLARAVFSTGTTPTPTATASSPTPTMTATATSTATPSPTPTTTATPTPGATLGQDTFQRANQSLWGKASDGQTWGGDANTVSSFSIASDTGKVTNTSTSYSAVLGPSATDAEAVVTGSISNFTNNNFGPVLRWTDGNNWYKAYLDGAHLIIQKKVSGTTTTLASVPFTAQANTAYTIHFRIVGTTLSANAWPASSSEPANWMATATDSSLQSGQCGLRVLAQNASVTITSFKANALS